MPFYLAELTEKVAQDDRIQILKASQEKLKVNAFHYLKNSSKLCLLNVVMSLLTLGNIFFFKEFISLCEAMELVPKEELETSTQGVPNSLADQRARKVGLISFLNCSIYEKHKFLCYDSNPESFKAHVNLLFSFFVISQDMNVASAAYYGV